VKFELLAEDDAGAADAGNSTTSVSVGTWRGGRRAVLTRPPRGG
jgi:hypothetical protein